MRALVCDWCGSVSTSRDGWYEVCAASASRHAAFDEAPRTFCGLDCLGDFVDDARTSPNGVVAGATPAPDRIDVSEARPAALAAAPAVGQAVPQLQPEEVPARPALVGLVTAPAAPAVPLAPAADLVADEEPPVVEEPLRGLGRGLGRTGS